MKLRNKKTGEIYEPTSLIEFAYEDSLEKDESGRVVKAKAVEEDEE